MPAERLMPATPHEADDTVSMGSGAARVALPRSAYARLLRILRILARSGWGGYLLRLRSTSARVEANDAQAAERLRQTIESLGPTFVKFGQLLSVRRDLLPERYIEELTRLQDAVPPAADTDGSRVMQDELGRPTAELFKRFADQPFAAASMAQVYDATLADGTDVVVKIQRRGIESTIRSDLAIMYLLARQLEGRVPASQRFGPIALVDEFSSTILAELDFSREGRNADRFRENFRDDPAVMVPRIYWELTTARVLTMARSPGHRAPGYDAANAAQSESGRQFAATLMRLFLTQVFEHGFFHGDPHPGNVFLLADGRLCFHDFGIVGELGPRDQEQLAQLILGVVARDAQWVSDAYFAMGGAGPDVDRAAFARDAEDALRAFYGSLGRTPAFGGILRQFIRLGQVHRIRVPRAFLLVSKAFMEVESQALQLDPAFDVIGSLQAYAPILMRNLLLPAIGSHAQRYRRLLAARHWAEELPEIGEKLAETLRAGRLSVVVRHEELSGLEQRIERASNRLSFSLIIASIVVASALLVSFHAGPHFDTVPLLGLAGFLVAGGLGLWWAFAVLRANRL